MLFGHNKQEDAIGMIDKYPLMNDYWADKRVDMSKITIPAYVLASYSTALHTVGSFRGFEELPSKEKWLRVHPTQEWHDLYSEACTEDLQRYFDCYLKGEQNDWKQTPQIRASLLRFNQDPIVNYVFSDWPIPDTDYRKLYLSGDAQLVHDLPRSSQTFSYQSDTPSLQIDADSEELHFSHKFTARSYLVGYSRAVLYVSCPNSDDLDVFIQLRKADASGKLLQNINIPLEHLELKAEEVATVNTNKYLGPTGILRASHRKIDYEQSKPHWPLHSHFEEEKVPRGQVVELTIGLWPTGMAFEAGEQLVLKIAGHHMTLAEFEPLRGGFQTSNKGTHVVHVGPEHPSHVVVPFVSV
ncbi:uncharacterized protein AB675_5453 [Cyphellophora attinorum]|uniref:Xaa-Pro dipeptidyl-peptidase C-terminal domain-containing protein n=1 Tax=Cyphellophora attinorum TaxID=1664694 RepID=A0A0N1P1P3_9EURO|nr:uncharacterized protein AB675_5453 [Phialophora attinorum]KPI42157.1 hypothetical protein AB675_5453 [Phialophora attinorum]